MTETKKEYIKKKLIDIHSTVEIDKKFNFQDVNIKAEEIFRQVLNATYSWNLIDANKKIKNFPAIDLIDESKKIVLQVTSSLGTTKINHTLDGFKKFKDDEKLKPYSDYRLMFCYIVKEKEVRRDKFLQDRDLNSNDFIDINDILEALDESNEGGVYDVLRGIYVDDEVVAKIETNVNAKNNFENLINNGKIIFGNNDESIAIKNDLKRKYRDVKAFKKAIFTYYSIYGTNFDSFRRATTFDEIFEVLEREEKCLYCLLQGLGKEYNLLAQPINCEELKIDIEITNKEEINGLILRINWDKNDKSSIIDGYLRFTSGSFEPLKNFYEEKRFNHELIKKIVQENLENRKHNRTIELQLILPNELYDTNMNFECENKKIKIVKRLFERIDNYMQLDIDAIRYWQRNSQFYTDHKTDIFENNFTYVLDDDAYIDEFQELDGDRHIYLLSDNCLHNSIKEIYESGVPFAFYSSSQECNIINSIDFTNKQVKDMKDTILRFMRRNGITHFIYDDYNDLEFLKVEGTDDDYL